MEIGVILTKFRIIETAVNNARSSIIDNWNNYSDSDKDDLNLDMDMIIEELKSISEVKGFDA